MKKSILITSAVVLLSLLFLQVDKSSKQKVIYSLKKGKNKLNRKVIPDYVRLDAPCLQKANQDSLFSVLKFASSFGLQFLVGTCTEREYTWATLDEVRLRTLTMYTKLALAELNRRSRLYFQKVKENCPDKNECQENKLIRPLFFHFIQIINATSAVDSVGNSRWRVDLMVEEITLHYSQRLTLDFTVLVNTNKKSKPFVTCAEYTSFPFPRYPLGYPTLDQIAPLPTEVIPTANMVLSRKGVDCNYPDFKELHLNKVWMENSDLALGTELPTTLNCKTAPALNDTSLPSSMYPKTRLMPSDIQLPEKEYADWLEKNNLSTNTDIYNDYALKPKNWGCGKPENKYHYTGSTVSYKQSMKNPTYPNGWVEPAVIRNKWPRLWSEPRDRYAFPCAQVGLNWDNKGVMLPQAKFTDSCTGNRWSTAQQPRTPLYWPTVTGQPVNAGANNWLFDNLRGGNATSGAAHPTR